MKGSKGAIASEEIISTNNDEGSKNYVLGKLKLVKIENSNRTLNYSNKASKMNFPTACSKTLDTKTLTT